MAQKNQHLEFTFILKLSKEDREKLNALQEGGLKKLVVNCLKNSE